MYRQRQTTAGRQQVVDMISGCNLVTENNTEHTVACDTFDVRTRLRLLDGLSSGNDLAQFNLKLLSVAHFSMCI